MIICQNCGVELEQDMQHCPLCGMAVDGSSARLPTEELAYPYIRKMTQPQRKFTWDIISLVLLSALAATLIINFILDRKITWAEYPAVVSLTIFTYVSLFAFWKRRAIVQIVVGFVISAGWIILIDALTGSIDWALRLGIPMLFAANLVIVGLLAIIWMSRNKGLNLLAWGFLGAAILCICIEGVLRYYQSENIKFTWSVIVVGCALPVMLVLLFVHIRLKKGRSLKKTFHI
jgi:hypothetical protein